MQNTEHSDSINISNNCQRFQHSQSSHFTENANLQNYQVLNFPPQKVFSNFNQNQIPSHMQSQPYMTQNIQNLNNYSQKEFQTNSNFPDDYLFNSNLVSENQIQNNNNIINNLNFRGSDNVNLTQGPNVNHLYSSQKPNFKNLNYDSYSVFSSSNNNHFLKDNRNIANYNNLKSQPFLSNKNYNNITHNYSDSASVISGISGSTYFSNAKTVNNLTRKVMKDEINTRLLSSLDVLLPKLAEECSDFIYEKFRKEFTQQNYELEEIKNLVEKLQEKFLLKIETKFLNENSTPMKNLALANENIAIIQKNLERKVDFFIEDSSKLNEGNMTNINCINLPNEMINHKKFFEEMNLKINGFSKMLEKEKNLANEINKEIINENACFIFIKNFLDNKVPLLGEKLQLLKSTINRPKENKYSDNNNCNNDLIREVKYDEDFINEQIKQENLLKDKHLNKNSTKLLKEEEHALNANESTYKKENDINLFNEKLNNLLSKYSTLKSQINNFIEDKNVEEMKRKSKNGLSSTKCHNFISDDVSNQGQKEKSNEHEKNDNLKIKKDLMKTNDDPENIDILTLTKNENEIITKISKRSIHENPFLLSLGENSFNKNISDGKTLKNSDNRYDTSLEFSENVNLDNITNIHSKGNIYLEKEQIKLNKRERLNLKENKVNNGNKISIETLIKNPFSQIHLNNKTEEIFKRKSDDSNKNHIINFSDSEIRSINKSIELKQEKIDLNPRNIVKKQINLKEAFNNFYSNPTSRKDVSNTNKEFHKKNINNNIRNNHITNKEQLKNKILACSFKF